MAHRSIFPVIFLSLLCLLFSNPCYSEIDTLHQGEQLREWYELTSSNRVFSLKFFRFGTTVSPYLGVFYRNNHIRSRCADDLRLLFRHRDWHQFCKTASVPLTKTAVWIANRNNPIPDTYGELTIDVNGKLSILSSGRTVVDLFNPTPLVTRNASVTLLDTGNLVLRELHPDGSVKQVLWQSFDYPTDTLLPGMKLGINLKTGHRWSLTSWRNDELPAEGLFTLAGDLNGRGQMVIIRQGNIHWMSGPWQDAQFKNTDLQSSGPEVRFDYVSNETEQSFTYLTRTYDSYPALRMHQDGQLTGSPLNLNLRCRSINDPPGCAEDVFEKSKCRKDYYFGSTYDCFYNTYSYADEYVHDESYNLYDCQRICWSNCSCVAYTTTRNRVGCKTYSKRVYNPEAVDPFKRFYTIEERKKMKKKSSIGLVIMIIPLVILLLCYCKNLDFKGMAKKIKKVLLFQMRRFYNYVRTNKNMNTELHYFTFQSISSATNNFLSTNKLGKGGFGEVYKGKLVDGQEVAVKRLSKTSRQGIKEFKNEIELIAKLQHTNLVRLLGYCVEKKRTNPCI